MVQNIDTTQHRQNNGTLSEKHGEVFCYVTGVMSSHKNRLNEFNNLS